MASEKVILSRKFYNRDARVVARDLLGKIIECESGEGVVSGKIVETEAYRMEGDPGSHSFRGQTARNKTMFGEAGRLYVYFIYGMYHCINVVTGKAGVGDAVLIRAVEPIDGAEIMKKNRKVDGAGKLTNGPGKVAMAFGITREHDGADLVRGPIKICEGEKTKKDEIVTATRIGILKGAHLPYRFYVKGNRFVSR